jgi:hypothetical protein
MTDPTSAKWDQWRGTPEHIAQIARVAKDEIGGNGVLTCKIAVGRPAYREVFDSPEAFREGLKPEALGDCKTITVVVSNGRLAARARFKLATRKKKAGVILRVAAQEDGDPRLPHVARKVRAAIDRGHVPSSEKYILVVIVYAAYFAVGASLDVLVGDRVSLPTLGSYASGAILLAVGFGVANWLRPAVEVALLRQSRLWRVVKVVGPVVLTVVVGALAKAIFGA